MLGRIKSQLKNNKNYMSRIINIFGYILAIIVLLFILLMTFVRSYNLDLRLSTDFFGLVIRDGTLIIFTLHFWLLNIVGWGGLFISYLLIRYKK